MKAAVKKIAVIIVFFLLAGCQREKGVYGTTANDTEVTRLIAQANQKNIPEEQRIAALAKAGSILDQKKPDTITREAYLKIVEAFYLLGKHDKAQEFSKKVFSKSESSNDYTGIAYSAYALATHFYDKAEYDSAYYYDTRAERAARRIKNYGLLGYSLVNKANILSFKKDFLGAEVTVIQALKIADKYKYARLKYDCYLTLGNALFGVNEQEMALHYFRMAYAATNELSDDSQQLILKAQAYNSIAKVYQKRDKHHLAVRYLNEALHFGNLEKEDIKSYTYVLNNLAYSKFKTGDPAALGLFEKVLRISDSLQNIPTQVSVKINLAEYYLSKNDLEKAMGYITDAKKKAHEDDIFEDELRALSLLSEINPRESVRYHKRYIALNDSLENNERAVRNKFARIEYETDEIVNQKNVALAEKKAISAQRWLIVGVSFMSILLLLSLFYIKSQQAKNKQLVLVKEQQKNNEEIYRLMLDQQQKIEEGKQIEKKRMSKELHDGIMGRLTSIRLNLFILNKKTDPETITKCLTHISEIQNIEKEIRIIAHDLNKEVFADNVSFVGVVENLFNAIRNHSDINFNINTDEAIDWQTISSHVKVQIYRILQESLLNIDKYAEAQNVWIRMEQKGRILSIEVADDGIGFVFSKIKSGGIGLKNMEERSREINGGFVVKSKPGKGTKINLTIPI